ncbi:MAG: oligosaccharide flippase family protein [Cyclobacteriaceae bacterium]
MNKLVKNISVYSIGNVLPQAAGFLLLPIYTKYLSPADYGIVSSMQVLTSILTVLFTMAIDRTVYRLYFDYKSEKKRQEFLGTITISLFALSTIVLLLIFLFKSYVEQIYQTIDFYPFYAYAVLSAYFVVFSLIPKIYYQLNEEAGKFVFISLLQFLLSTGWTLWFIIEEKDGAAGMLKGKMLADIFIAPLLIYISYKAIKFTFNLQILKASLSFGFPMIPGLVSAWILNLSDRIFIERYLDFNDVGVYSLAYKIAGVALIFTSAFNMAYGPIFYKLANSEDQFLAKQNLFKYNKFFTVVVILIVFTISLFAKEGIELLLDGRYLLAYKIVPLIAFSYLISQISGLFNLMIYQEKKVKSLMVVGLAGAGLNVLLNFLVVPAFGSLGAAYSTILSFGFVFLLSFLLAKKCYYIRVAWFEHAVYLGFGILIIAGFEYLDLDLFPALTLKVIVTICGFFFLLRRYKSSLKEFLAVKRNTPIDNLPE